MKSNATQFRELLREHNITRREAANMLQRDISTIDRWLTPATRNGKPNPTHRGMSDGQLSHFKLLVKIWLDSVS